MTNKKLTPAQVSLLETIRDGGYVLARQHATCRILVERGLIEISGVFPLGRFVLTESGKTELAMRLVVAGVTR